MKFTSTYEITWNWHDDKILKDKERKRQRGRKREKRNSCEHLHAWKIVRQEQTYGKDLGADYRNVPTLISLAFDLFSRGYESMRIGLRMSGTLGIERGKSDGWLRKRMFDRKQEYLRRKHRCRSGRTILQSFDKCTTANNGFTECEIAEFEDSTLRLAAYE